AVYLPLEPTLPPARIAYMLDRGGAVAAIASAASARARGAVAGPLVRVDGAATASPAARLPAPSTHPDELAYILFTSGSTGRPKPVMGTHRGLLNRLAWGARAYPFDAGEVACHKTALGFVDALCEAVAPLLAGAPLVVADPDAARDPSALAALIASHGVTRVVVVPSLLRALLEHASRLASVRLWITSGEALPDDLVAAFRAALPGARLVNVYGMSEASADSTYHDVVDVSSGRAPIGRAISGNELFVLDDELRVRPVGAVGELYVGGVGLARGYRGAPDQTAERFVPNPFSSTPGARLYRTGDLVRSDAAGCLVYVGRRDQQVKIRGVRVEPAEAEAALREHPGVRAAAVVVRDLPDRGPQLVAYVVDDGRGVDPRELRAHVARSVAEPGIPTLYVRLDALPTTVSGKIDRGALPAPVGVELAREPQTPADELEALIAAIWSDVLKVPDVDVADDFFALGGHSLVATRIVARVKEALGVEVPLRDVFREPTVRGMAAAIRQARGERAADDGVVIQPDPEHRFEPFPLTAIQEAYWLGRGDAFDLGGVAAHVYREIDVDDVDLARLERAIRAVVDRHDMLRGVVDASGQQRVLPTVPAYTIRTIDLRGVDAASRDEELAAIRRELSHQVFDPTRWPLFEVRAARLDDRTTRLFQSLDMMFVDAGSLRIVAQELVASYARPDVALAPLGVTFRDYVIAERAAGARPSLLAAKAYWQARLPTLPEPPALPVTSTRGAATRFTRREVRLSTEGWARLRANASRHGVTPTVALAAALSEVLATWSEEPSFRIHLTLFNRLQAHADVNRIVGDFTSVVLLEANVADRMTFAERARALQTRLWDDLDARAYDGVRVLRDLRRARPAVQPRGIVVLTSTLGLGDAARDTTALPYREVFAGAQTSQVLLDNYVSELHGGLASHWDLVEQAFPAGLVDEMFSAYAALLERLAGDDAWSAPVAAAPPAWRDVVARLNAFDGAAPEGMLQDAFLRHVERTPDALAVVSPTRRLTYAELHGVASGVANALAEAGVGRGDRVAVMMEKGWEQVAAVLAVLFVGAGYVPIDPELPARRREALLASVGARVALTQERVAEAVSASGVARIAVDRVAPRKDAPARCDAALRPTDLAYVIFTSGSTGVPKGVMIDHRGALNTIADLQQRFAFTPADRVLALSSLSFDLSVWDVFGVLGAGGALVLPRPERRLDPDHWDELVTEHGVTVWNTVPALMGLLLDRLATRASSPLPLRLVMLSGDWIPIGMPERIRAAAPNARIISMGGATEASIWSI
ncbi:MAG TPA: amino acid adenylation domain-containing protein, partial [Minicystis sp.]|nr:amino acid adenylation domain-containing protein [Minicystis sp.]